MSSLAPPVAARAAGELAFSWRRILIALLLVIMFIPIRRYKLPGNLPFQMEPYRLLVMLILAAWLASLLIDERVKLRASGLDGFLAFLVLATFGSMLVNPGRVSALEGNTVKALMFLLSFVAVFYLIVSVVRSEDVVMSLAKTLVAGGAVIAVLAVIESRTGFTPFTHLNKVFPFLKPDPSFTIPLDRGGSVRAFGPAEHPIALSAALVMLVPLALCVARFSSPRWRLAVVALVIGVLSTVSRTGIVMLFVVALIFLWVRPRETKRLWPALLPLLVLTHFAAPGTLGSIKQAFFPSGGLVAQQKSNGFGCDSNGRIADVGPTFSEISHKPFLGHGFGTRITTGPDANACVLDDQWLGTLVDVGFIGGLAWLLFFLAIVRRFGRASKEDDSVRGWLLASVAASVGAYAVGMLTFDALGFVQVTLFLFILVGLGTAAALLPPRRNARPLSSAV
jgi:hypothetical protein